VYKGFSVDPVFCVEEASDVNAAVLRSESGKCDVVHVMCILAGFQSVVGIIGDVETKASCFGAHVE